MVSLSIARSASLSGRPVLTILIGTATSFRFDLLTVDLTGVEAGEVDVEWALEALDVDMPDESVFISHGSVQLTNLPSPSDHDCHGHVLAKTRRDGSV